jgi:superfamily II DNA/RNA helicase
MPDAFKWNLPEGHALCHDILKETALPYEPHDHQVEGACQSLDGVNLLAITPTGSGKTAYYIIYMLVILAILQDPDWFPASKFPKNPCLIVICPTIPLQLEMVSTVPLLWQDSDIYAS